MKKKEYTIHMREREDGNMECTFPDDAPFSGIAPCLGDMNNFTVFPRYGREDELEQCLIRIVKD